MGGLVTGNVTLMPYQAPTSYNWHDQLNQIQTMTRDTRPAREQLMSRLQNQEAQIAKLQEGCEQIREALAILDDNPAFEKVTDVLRKILG